MTGWNIAVPTAEYYDHKDLARVASLVAEINDQKEIALDTETTGLISWKDVPLYWSLAWGDKRATLNVSVLHYFSEAFADPYKKWIFANAKYDAHILANVGIAIAGQFVDIQVMHSLLYEERSHSLKDIADHILGWRWKDFQDTFGKISEKKGVTAESVIRRAERENFPLLVEYAANDAWGTLSAFRELKKQLEDAGTYSLYEKSPPYISNLWDLFSKVEVPYTKVLWKTERNGIKVNMPYLEKTAPIVKAQIEQIEKEIFKAVGSYVNLNSPAQLQDLLFSKLGLTPIKQTKGGKSGVRKPSTDASVLEHYADEVPIAKLLLDHRDLSKFYGTYVVGLHEVADPNGRIHTHFNQDVARTGRLSSSGPNMQNIPTAENDEWKLRGAFVAEEGNVLVAADYQQLEMRLLAAASMEKDMIGVFEKNWDIHMGNASLMFGIPYEEIAQAVKTNKRVKSGEFQRDALTPRMIECVQARQAAKSIGFGLNYGMGPKKLARELGCTVAEAIAKINKYKATYPAVAQFYEEAIMEAEDTGFSFTILGRRRNVPELSSPNSEERSRGERVAVNTQIQGSAADVVKMAQILCDKTGIEQKFGCRQLIQVHDELVFECPAEAVAEAKEEIKEFMEHPFVTDLQVALTVDIGHGNSWMEAK